MGSEVFTTLKEQGSAIRRGGGEMLEGPPDEFIIIGLDKSVEEMLALYPDDGSAARTRARAIIRGVRDRTRAGEPPPDWFVATFARGQEEPGSAANLGPDKRGKLRVVVVKGRKRNQAIRAWNKAHPGDKYDYRAVLAPLKHNGKAGIDAELDALMSNVTSNVFVTMPESGKADHAAMLHAKSKSLADIAVAIGARGPEHVEMLIALSGCCEAVQVAVDANRYPLADVLRCKLHTLPEAEQVARISRATAAPKGANGKAAREARDAAAPARAKTRPARVLATHEEQLRARVAKRAGDVLGDDDLMAAAAADVLAWAQGKAEPPEWLTRYLAVKDETNEDDADAE